jgi:flagellar hook-associated protein 2
MASASVSGLVSGLDTATIISQLMQVEAQPQTLLKSHLSTEQTNITNLQSLNAKFAALATKAGDLAKPSAWAPLTVTSSSTAVTAVAGATATPGRLTFTVQATATAHQLSFDQQAPAGTDVVTTGSTKVRLDRLDGTAPLDIETGDGTLNGLVAGINRANAGITASAVKLDNGSYRLRVVSDTTGASSDFTLTNTDGSPLLGGPTVVTGSDAAVTIGSDTVHSANNTFTGLSTGLDVTIAPGTAAGTVVDITTTRDAASAQAAAKGLVDAANDLLAQIDKLTAYNATTKVSGPLAGDATVRDLRSRVLDAVTRSTDGSSLASVGIQTDRFGKIVFDATVFSSAYAKDPAAVAAKLGTPAATTAGATTTTPATPAPAAGFAARLATVASGASDSEKGLLTTAITNRQSSATTMQKTIDDWDIRLANKKDGLTRQFTALEVSLSKLQNQSSWLSGQLNSLSSSS